VTSKGKEKSTSPLNLMISASRVDIYIYYRPFKTKKYHPPILSVYARFGNTVCSDDDKWREARQRWPRLSGV
jgi:hypothetical protein